MGRMGPAKKSITKLAVSIHPRLHLTLLAMHAGEYRINGGVGFSIDQPACEIKFAVAPAWAIKDCRSDPLSPSEILRLESVLQQEKVRYDFNLALDIAITGNMRTHYGFGSGTSIRLACLEALHRMNDSTPTEADLVASSGRGGTSGIGIHTYFSGNCVFDLGKVASRIAHAPSHQIFSSQPPLVLDQLPMPEWDIGICIPLEIPHKTETEEKEFFDRICPIASEAAYEAIYHAIFGLYAAIREQDRVVFIRALKSIQECAWKKAERLEYGDKLSTIEQALYRCGADAVGMSSLGPSLFFLADDVDDVIYRMGQTGLNIECLVTRPLNSGRRWFDD